jgi:sterol desaturase/sphingolipid hydroxylase (fatty acid hydroxylase superfamily)
LPETPEMHRVHHSIEPAETNSNFGFNLPWWDWLFGTYRAQPAAGHAGMTIGIDVFRQIGDLRLDRMLIQPLVNSDFAAEAAIERQRAAAADQDREADQQ